MSVQAFFFILSVTLTVYCLVKVFVSNFTEYNLERVRLTATFNPMRVKTNQNVNRFFFVSFEQIGLIRGDFIPCLGTFMLIGIWGESNVSFFSSILLSFN